jgi:hypothetical protein
MALETILQAVPLEIMVGLSITSGQWRVEMAAMIMQRLGIARMMTCVANVSVMATSQGLHIAYEKQGILGSSIGR